jgi:hypothetical protein
VFGNFTVFLKTGDQDTDIGFSVDHPIICGPVMGFSRRLFQACGSRLMHHCAMLPSRRTSAVMSVRSVLKTGKFKLKMWQHYSLVALSLSARQAFALAPSCLNAEIVI